MNIAQMNCASFLPMHYIYLFWKTLLNVLKYVTFIYDSFNVILIIVSLKTQLNIFSTSNNTVMIISKTRKKLN